MKRLALLITFFLIGLNVINTKEPGIEISKSMCVYDICDIFLSDKPIFSLEMLFGQEINAFRFYNVDNNNNCMEFEYKFNKNKKLVEKKIFHIYTAINELRKYKYYSNGLLEEVVHIRNDYQKKLVFNYDEQERIIELNEYIVSDNNDEIAKKYDYISYRFNKSGNIIEVRGINNFMLGFKHRTEIIKIYDYDENNKLKAIRNFRNPEENKILSYDEFVKFRR